ncbi:MAG: hypothetical protein GAK35_03687 [Herbaspirillum frisingense]|uniref:Uncharacterized protein n=1 Tax=Herbaspirillum frisingense TaxID=92645 RepID=A0A7V8JSM3_9BURK|nr:MAG: hypothetical protein GAK35_03687 [Herbaspirillum frisingense]
MRRALDWLVVDAGGHAAAVVPFAGVGRAQMTPRGQADARPVSEMCSRILHALQGGSRRDVQADAVSAADDADDRAD